MRRVVTRRQSPVQITALGIIALPHSQKRHARQHHEPALPLEKSIEPGRTHPIPPAFSPTEFLRRLRPQKLLFSLSTQTATFISSGAQKPVVAELNWRVNSLSPTLAGRVLTF